VVAGRNFVDFPAMRFDFPSTGAYAGEVDSCLTEHGLPMRARTVDIAVTIRGVGIIVGIG